MMSVHWAKADIRLRASGSDFDPRVRPVKAHGGGWSNLWRLSAPDRWAWFIRKKLKLNPKSTPGLKRWNSPNCLPVLDRSTSDFGGTADVAFQAGNVR